MKTLYGVGTDWPISYEDLSPYYDRAGAIMNLSGPEGMAVYPDKVRFPQAPHTFSDSYRVLKKNILIFILRPHPPGPKPRRSIAPLAAMQVGAISAPSMPNFPCSTSFNTFTNISRSRSSSAAALRRWNQLRIRSPRCATETTEKPSWPKAIYLCWAAMRS